MASARPRPYLQFKFVVDLGEKHGPHAGFREFSHVEKITGLNKATDVTMKRGVISSSTLEDWLNQIRKSPKRAQRTVRVALKDDRHRIVRTWTLLGARIIKHVSPPLNAKGTDVAIDELVLQCERIEVSSPAEPQHDGRSIDTCEG